jgi:hypothetical protein
MNSTSYPAPSSPPELKKKFWKGYAFGLATALLIPGLLFLFVLATHMIIIVCFIVYNLLKDQ